MRRAFTLIELLVVISIIALLIAILLPVLSNAKESSRRAVCAINSRSLAQGHMTLSVDNKNRYRLNSNLFGIPSRYQYTYFADFEAVNDAEVRAGRSARDWSTATNWLTSPIFADLVDAGISLDTFTCPNRGADYNEVAVQSAGYQPVELPQLPTWLWVRIGYASMGGIMQSTISRTGPDNLMWISPASMEDPGDLPLTACILQYSGPDIPKTSYPHGPRGLIEFESMVKPADETESQGGPVSANDGSTQFVNTQDAKIFNSHTGSSTLGYWNYVSSYDKVNPDYAN